MRKLTLIILLAVALLAAGCGRTANEDIYAYAIPDANYGHAINDQKQLAPPYDKEPGSNHSLDSPTRPQNAIALSAANTHALALMQDGTLWGWGAGLTDWPGSLHSRIGDGTAKPRLLPVKVMEDVVHAVAGWEHSFAITADGVLWACAY